MRRQASAVDFEAYGSELLRRIAGTVAIMLYEMKVWPDGRFECLTFVGLETLIGAVPERMSPEEAYDAAVHPEDREKATDEALEVKGTHTVFRFRNRYRCKDGSYRWLAWSATPSPKHRLIYASARDVTPVPGPGARMIA